MRNSSFYLLIIFIVVLGSVSFSLARDRRRSGSYSGEKTSGTFQQNNSRKRREINRDLSLQNEKGQGSREYHRDFDKKPGTGSYSSSSTYANGKTSSNTGTIKRNEDGSFTLEGDFSRIRGKTGSVEKNIIKNDDGSWSADATYTSSNKTLTVNKVIEKDDKGKTVNGSYT